MFTTKKLFLSLASVLNSRQTDVCSNNESTSSFHSGEHLEIPTCNPSELSVTQKT